jgi:hypothetical protein
MQVTTLAEKAVLVKLTTRRVKLTHRMTSVESIVQAQFDDSSIAVLGRMFRDKSNPINAIINTINEAYREHRKFTLPYVDKGPRILPNNMYFEYSQLMHGHINHLDAMVNRYMPNYDSYVMQDIAFRSTSKTSVCASDYPTAQEFQDRVGLELRFSPMPDKKHFLFDMSDVDVANFSNAMVEVEAAARADAIKRMLEPLTHLVDKLEKPAGKQNGGTFRDSAIENIIEGIDIAKKLVMDDNPELMDTINKLETTISSYNPDWLRESPIVRDQAKTKLDEIAKQMGAFMGAA